MEYVIAPHREWLDQTVSQAAAGPAPPNGVTAAYDEAHALTQQLHRMAFSDGLPTADSQGLERLLFRLVKVNEALVGMLAEVIDRRVASSAPAHPIQAVSLDEVYQASYCDACGNELTPDGDCIAPSCPTFWE